MKTFIPVCWSAEILISTKILYKFLLQFSEEKSEAVSNGEASRVSEGEVRHLNRKKHLCLSLCVASEAAKLQNLIETQHSSSSLLAVLCLDIFDAKRSF